jgi:hypothetical protein
MKITNLVREFERTSSKCRSLIWHLASCIGEEANIRELLQSVDK